MARLVTYATFRSTQGAGRQSRPACYAVYRALLHDGPGDCEPSCGRHDEGGELRPPAFPHVDLANGELLAVLTPTDPKWSALGIARLYASDGAPPFAWCSAAVTPTGRRGPTGRP